MVFRKTRLMLTIMCAGIIALILVVAALSYYLMLHQTLENNRAVRFIQALQRTTEALSDMADGSRISMLHSEQTEAPAFKFDWSFLELDQFGMLIDSEGLLLSSSINGETVTTSILYNGEDAMFIKSSLSAEEIARWLERDVRQYFPGKPASTRLPEPTFPRLPEPAAYPLSGPAFHRLPEGRSFRTMLFAIPVEPDYIFLYTGKEASGDERVLANMRGRLLTLGAVLLLVATGVGYFLSGKAMVPIVKSYKRQQDFTADASHELRTPLTVLRSSTEILQEYNDQLPDFHRDVLHNMHEEISRMTRLVDGLLTLARSDSGAFGLLREMFDLRQAVRETVAAMGPLAAEAGVRLSFADETEQVTEALIDGDRERVKQLAIILIDNAIKYNRQDGSVRVRLTAGEAGGGKWLLAVEDTGIGIPKEEVPMVFERFFRADKARSRHLGGAGLGLSIAGWIAKAHGGKIRVSSEPGTGSVFTVVLPAVRV